MSSYECIDLLHTFILMTLDTKYNLQTLINEYFKKNYPIVIASTPSL